jgi:protein ImuA
MNSFVPVATIDALRERIRWLEGGTKHERVVLPFGVEAIDERLPEGGLELGALHEVAGGGNGAVDGLPLRSSPPASQRGPGAKCCGA